ncbi:hypothetical protein LINPERPRIM_LOCUS17473, partial [Linum perenne]
LSLGKELDIKHRCSSFPKLSLFTSPGNCVSNGSSVPHLILVTSICTFQRIYSGSEIINLPLQRKVLEEARGSW